MKERREVSNIRRAGENIGNLGASIMGGNIDVAPDVQPQIIKQQTAPIQAANGKAQLSSEIGEKSSSADTEARLKTKAAKVVEDEDVLEEDTAEKKKSKKKKSTGLAAEYLDQMAKVSNKKSKKGVLVYFDNDVYEKLEALIKEKTDKGISISRSKLINMIIKNSLQGDDED